MGDRTQRHGGVQVNRLVLLLALLRRICFWLSGWCLGVAVVYSRRSDLSPEYCRRGYYLHLICFAWLIFCIHLCTLLSNKIKEYDP
jgi:hypothetical protein